MRRKLLAIIAVGLLLARFTWQVPAFADPPGGPDYIALAWDDTTALDWRGGSQASAMGHFLGTPVVVPGDRLSRIAWVRNDGPSGAVASVQIVNLDAPSNQFAALAHLTVTVAGQTIDMTAAQLAQTGGTSPALTTPLGQGERLAVEVSFSMPVQASGGQHQGSISFDVRVTLTQDLDQPGVNINSGGTPVSSWPHWLTAVTAGGIVALLALWRRVGSSEPEPIVNQKSGGQW